MKYQSEIIHEILEQRGHGKSSLHYQSECIETWLEEVKGSYPKLTEYQAEWLNYMLENPLGEFPYVALIDVTGATVNNVVPYAYKSAILKGQTLVNIVHEDIYMDNVKLRSANYTLNGVKPDTNYLVKYTVGGTVGGRLALGFLGSTTWSSNIENQERSGTIILNSGLEPIYFRIIGVPGVDSFTNDDVQVNIIEYQQGMENWDISYFEGMQSVKIPVLTTSNEDGTKTNILTVNEPVELRGIGDVKDTIDCLTGQMTERIREVVLDGSESWESHAVKTDTIVFKLYVNTLKHIDHHIISDRFPTNASGDVEKITNTGNVVYLAILKSKADNLKNFKSYLSQNPITIQYQLATESIKTVELSITDESGNKIEHFKPIEGTMHIQTDGEPIKPTVSMEIPVEAIAQNLASFIGEE